MVSKVSLECCYVIMKLQMECLVAVSKESNELFTPRIVPPIVVVPPIAPGGIVPPIVVVPPIAPVVVVPPIVVVAPVSPHESKSHGG